MVKNIVNELLDSLPVLCLLSGRSSYYFGIGNSKEIAFWLSKRGLIILGIEGFKCDGVSVIPLVDYIADFSSITGSLSERVDASLNAALSVLPNWENTVEFIEFIIDDAQ